MIGVRDWCHVCEVRGPLDRGEWQPLTEYREGDVVIDTKDLRDFEHDELPGTFRALACQRSGFVSPRYLVIDHPGERWERVS